LGFNPPHFAALTRGGFGRAGFRPLMGPVRPCSYHPAGEWSGGYGGGGVLPVLCCRQVAGGLSGGFVGSRLLLAARGESFTVGKK